MGRGAFKLRWFNQPYIAKMYANGTLVKATGKVTGSEDKLYLANPQLEKVSITEAGLFETEQKSSEKKSGPRARLGARRETRGLFLRGLF
jgi:RecG-like helicase